VSVAPEEIALDRAATTRFKCHPARADWCKMALSGMRYEVLVPAGFVPRRVLDLGAQEGAFACWVTRKWPRAWVDLVEPEEALAALAKENMPPGAKMMSVNKGLARLPLEGYQLVRVGRDPGRDWGELKRVRGIVIYDMATVGERA